ncbi:recombinase family protein [Shinella zoogloeoides]|uniref:recombinase family protein n=1 Tax=Shinella zoogloeoides TaxID=352475 RepID=UPI00391855CD
MPNRAAIYARFSTDLQNENSTEDQIALCRDFARREGYEVIAAYQDQARSGASLHGRDGILDLLADAKAGKFDAVIVEQMDRLSRDMEDMAGMFKRLKFMNIDIIEVHGGKANTLSVGMRSIFSQLFREDNMHKVRRGMTGLIKQGLTAGGKAYGYQPDPANPGRPIIAEDEAEVVERIFRDYEAGISPRQICYRLNAEHVKPPRKGRWSPSALYGNKDRGAGILRNPIYVGRLIWNKNQMVKDPDTGKRVSRPNPPSEWQRADVPELRIIPDELFDAVQAQLAARSHTQRKDNVGAQRRPVRLLSGLLKCGACGAGMSVQGPDKSGKVRLRCSAHKNSRSCPDPKTYYLEDVEELFLDSLTRELATPDQIHRYAKAYMEKLHANAEHEDRRRRQIDKRLAEIEKDNERLTDMLMRGLGDTRIIDKRIKEQAEERADLERELRSLPEASNIVVLPSAIKHFADKLRKSRAKTEVVLQTLDDMGELPRLVRELVHSITLRKTETGKVEMEVVSSLEPFLNDDGNPVKANRGWGVISMVAEEGFEPPTQGL